MIFWPTTHKPYFYSSKYDKHYILLLCQVEDFAIVCIDEIVSKKILDEINSHMLVDIKYLGLLTRFNGVNTDQTGMYAKLHNNTYISKIIDGHKNWTEDYHCHTFPLLIKAESSYANSLEHTVLPSSDRYKHKLQREHKLNYRQTIGELIYTMITCRSDISFPLTKSSQYSANPTHEHYLL